MICPTSLQLKTLRTAYLSAQLTPHDLVDTLLEKTRTDPHRVWINRLPETILRSYADALIEKDPKLLPLYGVPFAIKDNIDLANAPTTAACPAFAYSPARHAHVVQRLIDAGAIPVGKTNMDQFATGLNGTRSPYGACLNSFNPNFISGGSSSGSAVAVALGYVSFALGTDTAGSGRVPAAFNNIVGHKPTRGWISSTGIVPACRSLDTVSIFTLTAEDAELVLAITAASDVEDPYSRPVQDSGFDFGRAPKLRVGVPCKNDLKFFGNADAEQLFANAVDQIREMGAETIEIDLQPFQEVARLLYEGPWIAERYAAISGFFDAHKNTLLPITHDIIDQGRHWSAVDAYTYAYKLQSLKQRCDAVWQQVDTVLTPTSGNIYSVAQMEADPLSLNSNLGYYTNFMNLLDYAAVAVPGGFQTNGLPFGVTFFAPANQDGPLLHLASRWQRQTHLPLGATKIDVPDAEIIAGLPNGQMRLAVCGAHMSGLPLNWQLTSRRGRLICATESSPDYKLFALPGGPPHRPGMLRVAQGGASIAVEVWELPISEFGSFVLGIPAPLGIGTISLADGTKVCGFICESVATADAQDITNVGSWRKYLAHSNS